MNKGGTTSTFVPGRMCFFVFIKKRELIDVRQSQLFRTTLREVPAEAEAKSHQVLLRGGYIRQLAAGVYNYLPLGWRVLRKIEAIIREEMDKSGAQELFMPAIQPAELWRDSGRYEVYGPELIRLRDRHEREFVLGPTHEEVITSLVRQEISSYRRLPVTLYQIQTKFRDERRPRFGLLRGREFLMKDAYSFDRDWDGLDVSYRAMYSAYERIFERCGLTFRAVEADAGAIGGEGETHEFMALAEIGEDTVVSCSACTYAANMERAEAGPSNAEPAVNQLSRGTRAEGPQLVHTPGIRTIEELTRFFGTERKHLMKTLIYKTGDRTVAVLVRGDRDVNETKVKRYLNAETLELAGAEDVQHATGAASGYAGPVGLAVPLLVDYEVAAMSEGIAGANRDDKHLVHVRPGIDFSLEHTGDFRNVSEGDSCPRCKEPLVFHRGIELGHVFKLGTKYSTPLQAVYLEEDGREKPVVMGCYGIGVSRVMAAAAEQAIREDRIVWPPAVAPFLVHIIPVSIKDQAQTGLAEQIYGELTEAGIDCLLDDRDERAGVKFKDADLTGAPVRIIVGRGASEGNVEWVGPDGHKVNLGTEAVLKQARNLFCQGKASTI